MTSGKNNFLLLLCGLLLTSCAAIPTSPPQRSEPVAGWRQENWAEARAGLLHSCPRLIRRQIGDTPLEQQYPQNLSAENWRRLCGELRQAESPAAAQNFFQQNFTVLPVVDGEKQTGLITGYYETELRASRSPDDTYRYPIYGLPPEAMRRFSRAEIDGGALVGQNLELFWAADAVALLSLHIQGSGKVVLPDGSYAHIGFAGKNTHPYVSIGKVMGERGLLPRDKIEMKTIEDFLGQNPQQAAEIIQQNPSYIFFRPVPRDPDGVDGPVGAYGIPLITGRSIAVDRAFYPLGIPLWLDVPHPDAAQPSIAKMVLAHDTGSAILGKIRADYFFGAGGQAKAWAGAMRGRGRMFVLLPKLPVAVAAQ
jgi:membrane-bound lytic murein transglycosylase A